MDVKNNCQTEMIIVMTQQVLNLIMYQEDVWDNKVSSVKVGYECECELQYGKIK